MSTRTFKANTRARGLHCTDNRTLRLRTSHGRTRVCVVTQRTARLHADITHAHKALDLLDVYRLNLLKIFQ